MEYDQGVLFWLIVVFFVIPIRYDPDGSTTTVAARQPRRANATQLRRAYERAHQELKILDDEREAQPKKRKIN